MTKNIKLTPNIYMWDSKRFLKCKNCGILTGTISFPECSAGFVACDMQPTTKFEDIRQFAWMAIQDKMWRYAAWENRKGDSDRWDEMQKYRDEVKAIMNDLIKMARKRNIVFVTAESQEE